MKGFLVGGLTEDFERMHARLEESLDLRDELRRMHLEMAAAFDRHMMAEEFALDIRRIVQENYDLAGETATAWMAGSLQRCDAWEGQ